MTMTKRITVSVYNEYCVMKGQSVPMRVFEEADEGPKERRKNWRTEPTRLTALTAIRATPTDRGWRKRYVILLTTPSRACGRRKRKKATTDSFSARRARRKLGAAGCQITVT